MKNLEKAMKFFIRRKKTAPFQYDSRRSTLTTDQGTSTLRPKTARLLDMFLNHRGEPLSKQHLLDDVWPGTTISENVLAQSVRELRAALGDDSQKPRFIRTVPKVGYEWIHESSEPDRKGTTRYIPVAGIFFLFIIVVLGWWYGRSMTAGENKRWRTEQIALLPIDNQTGKQHLNWVGGDPLDILTQQLPAMGLIPQDEIAFYRHVLTRNGQGGLVNALLRGGVGRVIEPVMTQIDQVYHMRIKTHIQGGQVRLDHLEAESVASLIKDFGQFLARGQDVASSFIVEAWQKGLGEMDRGDFAAAVDYFEICVREDEHFLPAQLGLGRSLLHLDQNKAAAEVSANLLSIAAAAHQPALLADVHRLLGDVNRATKAWDRATENFKHALALYEELGYELGRARVFKDLALVAREAGRRSEAEALFLEALAIREQEAETQGQAFILSQLARTVFSDEPERGRAYLARGRTLLSGSDGATPRLETIYDRLEQQFGVE